MVKTRKFGGKVFTHQTASYSKQYAKKKCKNLGIAGFHCNITEGKGIKKKKYDIWTRKLKRTVKIGKKQYVFKKVVSNKRIAQSQCKKLRKQGHLCRIQQLNGQYALYIRGR